MASAREAVEQLFRAVDIQIDGGRRWDIQVQDERFFLCVLAGGTLGFGEAYMGWLVGLPGARRDGLPRHPRLDRRALRL